MRYDDEKLELLTETTIYIPYEPDGSEDDSGDSDLGIFTAPYSQQRDLPDGPELRLRAFEAAWSKTLNRIKDVIRKMNEPVAVQVVDAVHNAYVNPLPLLPRTELPTIMISGIDRGATASFFEDVRRRLSDMRSNLEVAQGDGDVDTTMSNGPSPEPDREAYVISLSPSDCANLMAAMKALITGFVENPPGRGKWKGREKAQVKHSASITLAPYDINMLRAWYEEVCNLRGEGARPKLVVLVQDFEQMDPTVFQDIFYICSTCIPVIPFVFILALASPPTPSGSFIHATYPRKTLTLLELRRFSIKGGAEGLQELLLKTFFDTNFQPVVIPGASTIDFVVEQFLRYAMSFDYVITIFHLVYLRHFTEPLTVFVTDELLGNEDLDDALEEISDKSAQAFLQSVVTRLHHPDKSAPSHPNDPQARSPSIAVNGSPSKQRHQHTPSPQPAWRVHSTADVLAHIREARERTRAHAARSRFAFVVFRVVLGFLRQHGVGYKASGAAGSGGGLNGSGTSRAKGEMSVFEMMSACLRGTLMAKEGKYLVLVVKKLTQTQLSQLLSRIYELLYALPPALQAAHQADIVKVVTWMSLVSSTAGPEGEAPDTRPNGDATAGDGPCATSTLVGEWLSSFLSERMTDVMEMNLWDVWYTGNPSALAEILNPSPKNALIAGLMHPDVYLAHISEEQAKDIFEAEMLPDRTILVQRYMESGKLINVHDWYQAFAVSLDGERKRVAKAKAKHRPTSVHDDTTRSANGADADVVGDTSANAPARTGRRAQRGRGSATRGRSGGRKGKGRETGKGNNGNEGALMGGAPADHGDPNQDSNVDAEMEDPAEQQRCEREGVARFIRALHELDYLGFVRHTKRRREHVQKTVFDLPD